MAMKDRIRKESVMKLPVAGESTKDLLTELVAHLRQNRTQLREE